MLEHSGADGVMIGRAAMGQPWIVGDIAHFLQTGERRAPPTLAQRAEIAREHLEGLLASMGASAGLRHARKHLAAYVDRLVDRLVDGLADMPRPTRVTRWSRHSRLTSGALIV
jgi:tRNA-dihydrouridine synthase